MVGLGLVHLLDLLGWEEVREELRERHDELGVLLAHRRAPLLGHVRVRK